MTGSQMVAPGSGRVLTTEVDVPGAVHAAPGGVSQPLRQPGDSPEHHTLITNVADWQTVARARSRRSVRRRLRGCGRNPRSRSGCSERRKQAARCGSSGSTRSASHCPMASRLAAESR